VKRRTRRNICLDRPERSGRAREAESSEKKLEETIRRGKLGNGNKT